MKKFLTVLLALSVVFTYSFSAVGSVFADANVGTLSDEQQAEYDAAVGPNAVILNAKFETAWAASADRTLSEDAYQYLITKKAYTGLKDAALKAVTDYVYAAAKNNSKADALTELFDTNEKIMQIVDNALIKELSQAQFAIDYATEVAKLDTVDVTAYSKEAYDDTYTHQEKAVAIVTEAKEEAAAIAKTIDSDSTMTDCVLAWVKVNNIISNDLGRADAPNPVIKKVMLDGLFAGVYELTDSKVLKSADADAGKAEDEANKAALKAIVAKNVAKYKKDAGAAADVTLIAAYTECYNVLIDAKVVTNNGEIMGVTYFDTKTGTAPKLVDNYKQVQELVAFAEKYKAEKDADGNLVRDTAAIDKIVKDATEEAYKVDHATVWDGLQKAKNKIEGTTVKSTAAGLDYAKQTAKKLVANWVDDNSWNYYPAELAKINALVEEFNAKVDAATKTDDITKETTGLYDTYMAKIKAVDDMSDVNTALAGKTAYANAYTALQSYLTYYNGALSDADKATKTIDSTEEIVKDALNAFYGEKGARTEAELKALKDDILSIVDTLPTAGAQAAAKKAAQDAIDALPSTITLADEAKVQAAVDAAKAYNDLYGNTLADSYITALDAARTALYAAYRLDLNKKAIAVDKTDKAALKALADEFYAAQDKNGDWKYGNCLNGADLTEIGAFDIVDKALTDIRAAEKAAVKKAINAIPVNVTEADKAAVEAARALYDAYVAEYTDYEAKDFKGNAADEFLDCYRELALAEAALGLNEDPTKDVESLKITVSTKLYKGSKIRVKWTVKGDASNIDGYQVYKSTKAQKGYKFMGKTKKSYMDNKKNLKKGTRYFYKVRAYKVVDGVKYYSDWSNKGNRIYKK